MQPGELLDFLQHAGRDPSRLIFEDELTGVHNRRFLHSYLEHKVHWKSGADYPLSILILDLDRFKDINDTHGHATGDQLLTWVASVLRDVSGDQGLPVRFGGDEFIVLLPKTDDRGAREMAARLLQRVTDRPFRLRDAGVAVPVTLSIGIATAPTDGNTSRALLQAADTALYHAKQSGRNQAATAAEVDPKKVFPRTALHRLLASGIAGRDAELGAVSEGLIGLSRGQGTFLLFEGAPGMGKSTLLDTISRNLSGDAGFAVAQVAGDAREGYRPYVVATRLLVALLNRREDKGAALVQSLSPEDLAHLSQIVPQVGEAAAAPAGDETARRQGIFAALGRFLPRVVEGRPLVVILDDLHLADEASLLLLRALMQSGKLPLLTCGATLEPLSLGREEQSPPIERFYSARGRELGIQRLKLAGLSAEHIADYLRSVFPNLQMPDGFDGELSKLTQGNPLFLGEVIRKLVADRKVTLVGQEWMIAPIEAGYLPRSLEEIVRQKITALDAESRYLLEQASALGEDVPLSVLTGSSQLDENKVLEFLDRAEALGLVSLDFQRNDDVMRFLGKRVLEISYGAIDERRRKALHEQVGAYHEASHGQGFLPSASLLAYHFKRSTNLEKAQAYERAQRADAQALFDAIEAAAYSTELLEDEEVDTEGRLTPESVALIPAVGRAFVMAVRSIQLYPPESKAIPQAQQTFQQSLAEVLSRNSWLELSQDRRTLLANGQRVDLSEWSALAESLVELFDRFELQRLTFQRGVTDVELRTVLHALATTKPESIGQGFWKTLVHERGLTRIQAQQVRYSKVVRVRAATGAQPAVREEEPLDAQDLAAVPRILRALQAAAKAAKLYPVESEHVTRAVEQLRGSMQEVLGRRGTLTLARAEHALLGNGTRLDTAGYEALATQIVELLDAAGLESLTVLLGVQANELAAFLGALRELPAAADAQFWDALARDKGLTGLAFNHRKYARTVVHGLLAGSEGDGPSEAERDAAAVDRLSEEPMEALRKALPQFGKELLVKGDHALMRRLLHRQFQEFHTQDTTSRAKTVQACHALMQRLILGLQHKFAQLAAEFLLPSLGSEKEPQVLRELAEVLYSMASTSVQFADYQLAGRVLLDLRARQEQLRETAGREGANLAALLDRKLDAAALKLLDEDLRSGQPDRHERAAEVLGALGAAATPLLIEVIKQENDFRIRQLAARLLAETGSQAGEAIKRALVTEVIVEQRAHMLEVIDVVTKDLRLELEQCLRDPNPKVRRGAFQLFERLGQDELVPLVAPYARNADPAVARGAIRALTSLRSPVAVKALASLLETAKDESLVALLCQALGLSEQATAIDALTRVLGEHKVFFFGRRWGPDVRRTAALALKQIPHPSAAEALARYVNDRDPEVQQVARGRAERASRPIRASGALRAIGELPPEA